MSLKQTYLPQLKDVETAAQRLNGIAVLTPLMENHLYSKTFEASIYFKREDLQPVRSYKIRGAYNKMASLDTHLSQNGIVCASAGNHAQGVALSCKLLKIHGTIYMPTPTPNQKINQVKMFGEDFVDVVLVGDTYDDAYDAAIIECERLKKAFIHPFDDKKVIEGQATVGLEIIDQATIHPIHYVIVPVGGGGLSSGLASVFHLLSPNTKIIGVEPQGAPSMSTSIQNNKNTTIEDIDSFVDGAAVKRVGDLNFEICKSFLDQVITVPEGEICQTILDLYNNEAIVVEPAGALSITALNHLKDEIKSKNVVCVVSGSNNDIVRTAEIKERALLQSNLKHYFIVKFPQRAGALKEFVVNILGPNDDITHFEYTKKTNRINGSAVVGIELKFAEDFEPLVQKMKLRKFYGDYLNNKPDLFDFLV
ncbi:threonine ammonia-lyase IlvA [Aurantibacter aestuarii]|uniref:L-threonine dehydratase n=1 Tax=Aurantibacter aestuarii TaxID=1266046 RepID=A0A2T1NEG5_9FLAO|nr:threonine ammonia-lyase IlvA [Aurantibacter aestuarii]PSG90766.1 threonine dehydratase [Aurantibacter aestuarii]